MLQLKDIRLDYPGKPRVLAGVDLKAAGGQVIGLVAPNGMGKTTLLNVILNRLHPSRGQVLIDGETYAGPVHTRHLHSKLCSFPEQADLYPELTGRVHLQFYADCWGNHDKSVASIIDELHMADYIDRPVATYSLGMRQRMCFALVVAANTPIMLLDEVMNGLDPLNVALLTEVIRQLRTEGKLIIMVSHLLHNLERLADRVLFLKGGTFVRDVDRHAKQAQYLKFEADVLGEIATREHYDQHTYVIPLARLTVAELNAACQQLIAAGLPYSVGELTLEEQFDHFYRPNEIAK